MRLFKKKKKLNFFDEVVFETFQSIKENWYFWNYEKLKEDNYNGKDKR